MSNGPNKLKQWEASGEVVISWLLANPDPDEILLLEDDLGNENLWPESQQGIYRALASLALETDPVITPESVSFASGADVDELGLMLAYGWKIEGSEFEVNKKFLMERGMEFGMIRILKEAGDAAGDVYNRIAVAHRELEKLESVGATKRDPAISVIMDEQRERYEQPVEKGAITGLPLDAQTLGNPIGHMTVTAAPYKNRKTTMLVNEALGAAARGTGCFIGTLETRREEWSAKATALVATQILDYQNKLAGLPVQLSSGLLEYSRDLGDEFQDAIWHAQRILARLPIQIVDVLDGARNPNILKAKMRKAVVGGIWGAGSEGILANQQVKLAVVDFQQLLRFPSNGGNFHYDQANQAGPWATEIAATIGGQGVHLMVASQKNADGVNASKDSGPNPNLKGGGTMAELADNVFGLRYTKDDPDIIKVTGQLVRHSAGGLVQNYVIHPPSGLITRCRYMGKDRDTGEEGEIARKVEIIPEALIREELE